MVGFVELTEAFLVEFWVIAKSAHNSRAAACPFTCKAVLEDPQTELMGQGSKGWILVFRVVGVLLKVLIRR